jgi:hypothetical protein
MAQDVISGFFLGNKNGSHLLQGQDTAVFDAWHRRRHTFHWFVELPNVTKFLYSTGIVTCVCVWTIWVEPFSGNVDHLLFHSSPEGIHLFFAFCHNRLVLLHRPLRALQNGG